MSLTTYNCQCHQCGTKVKTSNDSGLILCPDCARRGVSGLAVPEFDWDVSQPVKRKNPPRTIPCSYCKKRTQASHDAHRVVCSTCTQGGWSFSNQGQLIYVPPASTDGSIQVGSGR